MVVLAPQETLSVIEIWVQEVYWGMFWDGHQIESGAVATKALSGFQGTRVGMAL